MRAITYTRFGPAAEVLSLQDVPTPAPGPGEVLVRLATSGVNPSDVRARAGGRPDVTAPPFAKIIPHSDGAGEIVGLGAGVPPDRLGERVWLWNAGWQRAFGTAAELIALPQDQAVPLPKGVSYQTGATLGIPAMTACHAVLGAGPVAGQTLLIAGAAGTVGHLAVQVAVAAGAQVIATARGAGLAAARAAGAHHVIDYTTPDLAAQILAAAAGAPISRILEVEFGRNLATNTEVIAPGGTIAAFGSAQDMTPTLPFYPLMFKAVTLELVLVYLLSSAQRATAQSHLTDLLTQGALTPRIDRTLPLEACAQAHDLIAQGGRAGSVLLTI